MLWLFLGGILSINFISRSGDIKAIDFSNLFPVADSSLATIEGKEIMILDHNLALYQKNSMGGCFLNWELSAPIFSDMSTYEHVEIISSCFNEYPPEIILDKNNLMKEVIHRIPSLGLKYKREGEIYRRTNN